MLKKLMALMLALFTFAAFAAVDVNKATQAELDGIKGIGPGIAGKIMDERKKGSFKDWGDFIERVKGVGEGNAAKFSAEGLTVNGSTFKGIAAAPPQHPPRPKRPSRLLPRHRPRRRPPPRPRLLRRPPHRPLLLPRPKHPRPCRRPPPPRPRRPSPPP
jgi:competence protein ComEA